MQIDCTSCGTTFDTERDPPAVGADTWRCRSCGHKHDRADYPAAGQQTLAAGDEPVTIEVNGTQITIG